MSRRFFDSMLEDLEYINYQRWLSNQSHPNFGVPEFRNNAFSNQYDSFNRGCYFPPYSLIPNTAKKNRESYYLVKRNEDRNYFPNNYYFGNNQHKGFGYPSNRRMEDNKRLPRSTSSDLLPRNSRRQFTNWTGLSSGQQYNDNHDEDWFMKRQSRGFNKDNNVYASTSRLDNKQNKYEYLDPGRKDEMVFAGQSGFHQSSSSLINDMTNQKLDNCSKAFGKNGSNNQMTVNSTTLPSPEQGTEYASWYCAEEQQQIVNMLRDVNYRHERQLRRDLLTAKNNSMSLDDSASSTTDHNSSDGHYGSYSSDEDDGITVLVSPTDHPLNDVMDMQLSIGSDDLIEKSTSDYFEEFQNIFTTSPEKNIINTLVKECFKEQLNKSIVEERASLGESVVCEIISDKCNNNVGKLDEVVSSKHNSLVSEGKETPASGVDEEEPNTAETTRIANYEKVRRLSPAVPVSRCFALDMEISPSNITKEKDSATAVLSVNSEIFQKVEQPKNESVIKVMAGEPKEPETARIACSEKVQRLGPDVPLFRCFESGMAPSSVTTSAMANSAKSVPSGSSESPVLPRYGSVKNQMSLPSHMPIMSSNDQILLTDYHRKRIQMQKYDFDCKFKNASDHKPLNSNSYPQTSFPVVQTWKPIQSAMNPSLPSMQSHPRNFVPNRQNNLGEKYNRVSRNAIPPFQTREHMERSFRQFYKPRPEKGRIPPFKNIHIDSLKNQMPDTGNVFQSDSCLLRNLRLSESDYKASSMSETNLQIKSSKDLDRIYKRISLEELFATEDEQVRVSGMMNNHPSGPFKLDPPSKVVVSPSDHLKHILKIGAKDIQASTTESTKFQLPLQNKVEKSRISTACQTEATDEESWNKSVSDTAQKGLKIPNNSATSASKVAKKDVVIKKKTMVSGNGSEEKNDLKCNSKTSNGHNADKVQTDGNISYAINKNLEQNNDVQQKDGTFKKGQRKKGKTYRNKLKMENKNETEISCCEKCKQNTDIMNFSENGMQLDIVKQSNNGASGFGVKKLSKMKGFEEANKSYPEGKETEKEKEKIQFKDLVPDCIKVKPITSYDILVKNSSKTRPKNIYKDVFKEFSKPKTSPSKASPLLEVRNGMPDKEDNTSQEPFNGNKKILENNRQTYKSTCFNKVPDSSQGVKDFKSDYNDLARIKTSRWKKPFRKFEKTKFPNQISADEPRTESKPTSNDPEIKSSNEFKSSHHEQDENCSKSHSNPFQGNSKEDRNILDSQLETQYSNLARPQAEAKQTEQEVSSENLHSQKSDESVDCDEKIQNDVNKGLSFSVKSHVKPGIIENTSVIYSRRCYTKKKERLIHNVNAPIQEKDDALTDCKDSENTKSEIFATG